MSATSNASVEAGPSSGASRGKDAAPAFPTLLVQVAVARAVDLARAGRYDEAEVALATVPHESEAEALVLGLLARIRAQQGRFAEADALWVRVLMLEPANEAALAGRRQIAVHRGGGRIRSLFLPALTIALALLVMVVGGLVARAYLRDLRVSLQREVAAAARVRAPAPGPASVSVLPAPEGALDVAGVTSRTESGRLMVSFDQGLFTHGTHWRPEARATLRAVADRLAPKIGEYTIEVVGRTDGLLPHPTARFHTNTELALARAVAVVGELTRGGRLPASALRIDAGGLASGRLPEAARRPDPAARTIELRVSRRQP
jgi:flagellar motor protein MotB